MKKKQQIFKRRRILACNLIETGYGTSVYDVKYQGDWNETALINCVDLSLFEPNETEYKKYSEKQDLNFGGGVFIVYRDEGTGITRAKVGVYYD